MFRELVFIGWDNQSRYRQRRLALVIALAVLVLSSFYLWHWPSIHDTTEMDPDRHERISRCC